MKKQTVKDVISACLSDLLKSILGGLVVSTAFLVVVGIISGIVSGFNMYTVLNVVRSALFIVGACSLFVLAGIMIGQKSNAKIRSSQKWKSTFKILGPSLVLFIVAVSILSIATIVDYIVWLI